ncbi:MAG: glycosyltransferase family 2 protein, partial [Lachnospiraceae bacterium]|nr:glycosyltransferase family 2 protein [Lachnospiraceae bacterium]
MEKVGEQIAMKKPDISIIIPIFNVSDYIIPCLESVNDTCSNLNAEIILIDDESEDDSGILAEKYAQTHNNFFFYKISHGGLSKARNVGVSRASGKYFYF